MADRDPIAALSVKIDGFFQRLLEFEKSIELKLGSVEANARQYLTVPKLLFSLAALAALGGWFVNWQIDRLKSSSAELTTQIQKENETLNSLNESVSNIDSSIEASVNRAISNVDFASSVPAILPADYGNSASWIKFGADPEKSVTWLNPEAMQIVSDSLDRSVEEEIRKGAANTIPLEDLYIQNMDGTFTRAFPDR